MKDIIECLNWNWQFVTNVQCPCCKKLYVDAKYVPRIEGEVLCCIYCGQMFILKRKDEE